MSNENKKAWISLIVPISFALVLFFAPRPDVLDNIGGLIILFVVFLILQNYLTKFLNKKFPTYKDLND